MVQNSRALPATTALIGQPCIQEHVRSEWVSRVVDAAQILGGALRDSETKTLGYELTRFERRCTPPKTTAERFVLRALLLDVFLQLENALGDRAPVSGLSCARALLQRATPESTFGAFMEAARKLITTAGHAGTLPLHERARRWISEHLEDRHSVPQIAAHLGSHPRTLRRQFVKHVGMTMQQYRWECRAARAEALLTSSDLKVDAVVGAIGVGSRSTLYRLMRRCGRSALRRVR